MNDKNRLEGKKILIVDDEQDVLETLEELLSMCRIEKASTFEDAWERLGTKYYDIAILDIMGVQGYNLLEIAKEMNITAVMLTAHALTPDNVVRSYKEGAAYFIPKDEMVNITTHLNDILEAKEKGQSTWKRWIERLGAFFDNRFGPGWKGNDKEFWDKYIYYP